MKFGYTNGFGVGSGVTGYPEEGGVEPTILRINTENAGTSASDSFTLALKSDQTYDFTVDWGDGNIEAITSSTNQVHQYDTAGFYDVKVIPQEDGTGFPGFYYVGTNDDTKITQLRQWGGIKFSYFADSFWGCSNMEMLATDACDVDAVESMYRAFNFCSSMVNPPIFKSTANVTTMGLMFGSCTGLTAPAVTSNLTNCTVVTSMYSGCTSLASFPVMDFSSSSVIAAATFLNGCSSLTGAAPSYDMSSFTSANKFYSNCSGITSIPYCDTGSVTTGSGLTQIFNGCSSVTTFGGLNFAGINGSAGGSHFTGCSSATTISALDNMTNVTSGFTFNGMSSMTSFPAVDVSSFTNLSDFFKNCSSMVTAPSLTTTACTDMGYMFYGCTLLTTVPVYDTAGVLSMDYCFQLCTSLTTNPAWDYSDVTNPRAMFLSCSGLTSASAMDFSSATTLSSLFAYCSDLTTCGTLTTSTSLTVLSSLFNGTGIIDAPTITVTSNVTNWASMFLNSYVETCPTYDTSAATDMNQMFKDIYSSTLDIPAFDFSNVTNLLRFAPGLTAGSRGARSLPAINAPNCTTAYLMGYTNPNLTSVGTLTIGGASTCNCSYMFWGSANLTGSITMVAGSGVNNMSYSFRGTGITGITLTGTSGVTSFIEAFYLASSLASVNLIDTSAATNCTGMFRSCTALEGFAMPTFDLGAMTTGTLMFSGYAMTTASWDDLLVATEANNTDLDCTWHGGNATYTATGETARDLLTGRTPGWSITDGGLEP